MTVSLNYSLTFSDVMLALGILRNSILEINRRPNIRFVEAAEMLKAIRGINDLGAQHLISIMALSGIINKPGLAADALVCKGTKTLKKIQKLYGIPYASINKVYRDLALELDVTVATIENAVCEMFRDSEDGEPFRPEVYATKTCSRQYGRSAMNPDIFFFGQRLFQLLKTEKDSWTVQSLERHSNVEKGTFVDVVTPVVFKEYPVANECPWTTPVLKSMAQEEVKISVDSRVRITTKAKQKLICNPAENPKRKKSKASSVNETKVEPYCGDGTSDAFVSSIPRNQKMVVSSTTRTTRHGNISLQNIAGATREEGTYQYFDPVSVSLKPLAASYYGKNKKPGLARFLKTIHREDTNGRRVYSSSICMAGPPIRTFADAQVKLRRDLAEIIDGVTYYRSKAAALDAILLRALCEIPYLPNGGTNQQELPAWVDCYLPIHRHGQPSRDFCVLYRHNPKELMGDNLFGVLTFRGCKRVFLVPENPYDLGGLWQEFNFLHIALNVRT
jgi:hypothetical protein